MRVSFWWVAATVVEDSMCAVTCFCETVLWSRQSLRVQAVQVIVCCLGMILSNPDITRIGCNLRW